LENYQKPCNNDTHGYDGPIAISNGGTIKPVAQDFLRACDALGIPFSGMVYLYGQQAQLTMPFQDDLQDLDTAHAAEIWAKYINR
jgi:alcohol oxidase